MLLFYFRNNFIILLLAFRKFLEQNRCFTSKLDSDVRDYNVLQSSVAVSCLIQLDVDTTTEEYVNDT
jgi:hypothetical protein